MLENNPEDVVAVLFPNGWHTVNQKSFTFIKSCFPGKGKETVAKASGVRELGSILDGCNDLGHTGIETDRVIC
jgi:hypothetical protein